MDDRRGLRIWKWMTQTWTGWKGNWRVVVANRIRAWICVPRSRRWCSLSVLARSSPCVFPLVTYRHVMLRDGLIPLEGHQCSRRAEPTWKRYVTGTLVSRILRLTRRRTAGKALLVELRKSNAHPLVRHKQSLQCTITTARHSTLPFFPLLGIQTPSLNRSHIFTSPSLPSLPNSLNHGEDNGNWRVVVANRIRAGFAYPVRVGGVSFPLSPDAHCVFFPS